MNGLTFGLYSMFLLVYGCPLKDGGSGKASYATVTTVSHEVWGSMLVKHVDENGNVDYDGFKKDGDRLHEYLNYLADHPISENAPKEERLAYFINLYNAGTVQLILEKYPLKSIRDIFRPWGKDRIRYGGEMISLGDIEHKILRKMDEPRIHFAINCASYSCPKLLKKAFLATSMETQLEHAATDFINDPTKNNITATKVGLSKIFSWFKEDFTKQGSLIAYLNKYSKIKILDNTRLTYLKYDWRLNESR